MAILWLFEKLVAADLGAATVISHGVAARRSAATFGDEVLHSPTAARIHSMMRC